MIKRIDAGSLAISTFSCEKSGRAGAGGEKLCQVGQTAKPPAEARGFALTTNQTLMAHAGSVTDGQAAGAETVVLRVADQSFLTVVCTQTIAVPRRVCAGADLAPGLIARPPELTVHVTEDGGAVVAALTLVGDFDAVTMCVCFSTAVSDAVGPADGIVPEAVDLAGRSADMAFGVADEAITAILVGAALSVAALAVVCDLDAGTLGFTRVCVGVSIDATDRLPQARARTGFVGCANTGATAMGITLSTRRSQATFGDVAVLAAVALVVRPTDLDAFAFVGHLDALAAGVAAVAVRVAVDATDRLPQVVAEAGLLRDTDTGAAAVRVVQTNGIARELLAHLAALTLIIRPARFLTALTFVSDLGAVAPSGHGTAAVGDAVGPTDRLIAKAHDLAGFLTEVLRRVTD